MAEAEARVAWLPLPVPLPEPGRSVAFELASRRLLLCNAGGTPYVIEDACPHVRVSMAGGTCEGTTFECPHHGGQLDLRDGRPLRLPIRRGAETYALRRVGEGWEVAVPQRR